MIESVSLVDVATFSGGPHLIGGLANFNYFFGSNGTGKSTIARVIADVTKYPNCRLGWRGGTALHASVFNTDFVAHNFDQSEDIPGIFTLGEQQRETLDKIEGAKAEIDAAAKKLKSLHEALDGGDGQGGKMRELADHEEELKKRCWARMTEFYHRFSGPFEGYRKSKEKFKEKILSERESAAQVVPLPDLENRAATLFGASPVPEMTIPLVEDSDLVAHESNSILSKVIVGKEDVDIAAMIQRLGSSDWVRDGRGFFDVNEGRCPFCQQPVPDGFVKSLEDFFDETFNSSTEELRRLETAYQADAKRVLVDLEKVIEAPGRFLDLERLQNAKALLESQIQHNLQVIAGKRKAPSQPVTLDPLTAHLESVKSLINAANLRVAEHNEMVANLEAERRNLTAQVWKHMASVVLKVELDAYDEKKTTLTKAIAGLTDAITAQEKTKEAKTGEIRLLEKTITSVQPTVDGINTLLKSFGFSSFSLAKSADGGNRYRLVRPDGSDAKKTLSEGERAFVAFLYFYYLLKGSESESGVVRDRVVVFDDPVSSLDCEVLFIVSSLIKGLIEEVRAGAGTIKQIFVLTHNVYFHREVTYNRRRRDRALNEETFWIVRRVGAVSRVEKQVGNPIKTTYELLWTEVRNSDRNALTLPNTLRRILETYFKIFGNIDFDGICDKFSGNDKIVCRSLFSWVHGGSHNVEDDLFAAPGGTGVETYLSVFHSIFTRTNHEEHFQMMMGNSGEDFGESRTASPTEATAPLA